MPSSLLAQPTRSGFSLSCVGLDWNTELSLKSLLTVIGDKAPGDWCYVTDVASADVVLYDPANALAQALLRRSQSSPAGKIFVACTSRSAEDGLHLRTPISPSKLISILEFAVSRLDAHAVAPGDSPSLCQRLDSALRAPEVVGVTLSTSTDTGLICIAQRAIYWPRRLTADELASILLDSATVKPFTLRDTDAVRLMNAVLPSMVNWDATLWAIGVSTSAGRLLSRLDRKASYRITRWPDFGVIGRRSSDIRCSAMMAQRAFSADDIARATGIPAPTVYGFVNASALCGMLKADAVAELSAPLPGSALPSNSFAGGVIRKLRQVFSLGAH